jgi:molybdenum cofactor cytidylyltransferase
VREVHELAEASRIEDGLRLEVPRAGAQLLLELRHLRADRVRIRRHDMVTLVGGGGKTTLMFRLAKELTGAGAHVVTTMTTRIFVGQMALAPVALVLQDETLLLAQVPGALAENGHVLLAGSLEPEADKVQGLAPDVVNRVAALPGVDAIIVEADGSRRLPFKAPADHEPVIPSDTTIVVPVVGMDIVGRPLTAENVHRPHRIAALTGAATGAPVTPEMIATVLAHPGGGAKGTPTGARLAPFLNKTEDDRALADARSIARILLQSPGVDSVLIGATAAEDPVREIWSRVGAVVLAAGGASRFGALKQVMPWGSKPLVAHVADQALGCPDVDRVAVTLGAGADVVRLALGERDVRMVLVADWAEGQSRSVKNGLIALLAEPVGRQEAGSKAAGQGALGAAIFLLADQPGVTPELLSALVQRHRETLAPVVAPRYRGQRGNPVLFDQSTFNEFPSLQGDAGARPILQSRPDEIAWVDWPTPEVIQDIDTSDDYMPPAAGAQAS